MTSPGPSDRTWSTLPVLLVCLALTAMATFYVHREIQRDDRLRFDRTARAMQRDVEERMDTYVTSLRGVAALFAASDEVTRKEFRNYVNRIDVVKHYPGIQGIGFAPKVTPAEIPAVEQKARSEGETSFHLWSANNQLQPVMFPPLFLEPTDERNIHAMGFDMYSEPTRRAAMDKAWVSGSAVATGRVQLVQEISGPKQPGFLIYAPIYADGGIPATEQGRKASIRGFAYAAFRAGDLLDAILQEEKPQGVSIEIYDGNSAGNPDAVLFQSDHMPSHYRPVFTSEQQVKIARQPWTLVFRTNPKFQSGGVRDAVTGVAVFGTIFSLLLYAVVRAQAKARALAEERAAELRDTTRELQQANAAKDQFLAVLSHELRTPLTPVVLAVSAMEEDEQLPAHLLESMRMVRRNVELESRLIDDLLDLTRISRGKVQFHMENVDVHEVLQSAVRVASEDGAADAKGVKILMDLHATQHVVRGDAARLQQVFWNVVKNSVKFTPHGGSIFVSSETANDRIVVKVRDTGAGIEPALLSKIFNAFEQGERSVTRIFGGLGLGLAISRSLVEAHGGKIVANSEGRGKGAEFVIELPTIAEVVMTQQHEVPVSPHIAPAAKVLLVEDHADTARVLARLLNRDGYDVKTAGSVQEAVAIGRSEHFDLVVSDLGLPDGSGLEILKKIQADGTPSSDVRGIALTGYGMDEDVRRTRDAGYGEHLTKPVDVKQLEEAIARQLKAR